MHGTPRNEGMGGNGRCPGSASILLASWMHPTRDIIASYHPGSARHPQVGTRLASLVCLARDCIVALGGSGEQAGRRWRWRASASRMLALPGDVSRSQAVSRAPRKMLALPGGGR